MSHNVKHVCVWHALFLWCKHVSFTLSSLCWLNVRQASASNTWTILLEDAFSRFQIKMYATQLFSSQKKFFAVTPNASKYLMCVPSCRNMSRRIARHGYCAILPDLYHKFGEQGRVKWTKPREGPEYEVSLLVFDMRCINHSFIFDQFPFENGAALIGSRSRQAPTLWYRCLAPGHPNTSCFDYRLPVASNLVAQIFVLNSFFKNSFVSPCRCRKRLYLSRAALRVLLSWIEVSDIPTV